MTQPPDLGQLAAQIAVFLAPYLPYLVKGLKKAGEKAFEKGGEKVTEAGWDLAQKIWGKIHPKAEKKPEILNAMVKAVEQPTDPNSQAVLTWFIQDLLKEMPAETQISIDQLMNQVMKVSSINIAQGNRSVAIQGDVTNTKINTGDVHTKGETKEDEKE